MLSVAEAAPARIVTIPPTFLHCPLRRLADGSRPPTPRGSPPPFGWGDVPTPIRPITGRRSLAPSSFTRCPVRSSYDSLCCPRTAGQRAYHVPQVEPRGRCRSRLFAGGTPSAPGEFGPPGPDHVPFWPKPNFAAAPRRARLSPFCNSTFGLSFVTTINDASPGLTLPPDPRPRPPWCWQSPCPLTLARPPAGVRIHCLGSFAPSRYQERTSR